MFVLKLQASTDSIPHNTVHLIFGRDQKMENYCRHAQRIQQCLAKNVITKHRLMQEARYCLDQTLASFQKTLENIDDQWMQELTFLRGENAVLDAEYYRTQTAIRQLDADLGCANNNEQATTSSQPRQECSPKPVSSFEEPPLVPTPEVILREARRDRALYYDQVLSLRLQCKKVLKGRALRTLHHFKHFDQQLVEIGRGLQEVLRRLQEPCLRQGAKEKVLAHPVVSCFALASRGMRLDVIEETVRQAQEEFRKLEESLKRCRSTKSRQTDRALHSLQDYDVEESLLPRFCQQVSEDLMNTGDANIRVEKELGERYCTEYTVG